MKPNPSPPFSLPSNPTHRLSQRPSHKSKFLAIIAAVSLSPTAFAALTVVNGDFQDTTGLTALNHGWYRGVPTGWTTAYAGSKDFAVGNTANLRANLEHLARVSTAPFYQDLGTLDTESTITLTFDSSPFTTTYSFSAAIWSNSGATTLATLGSITTAGTKTLTVSNVAAGTAIRIGFWRESPFTTSNAPGIDNVTMTVVAIPEPGSLALLGLGGLLIASRRRRG